MKSQALNVNEVERIRLAYDKRRKSIKKDYYSLFRPINRFIFFQREKKILELINKYVLNPLRDKKILDLGCGAGGGLRNFIQYGALPENLYGIDILEDKIEQARMLSPNMDFRCENAENLAYEDKSFDIVMQFTVFTSILDEKMKRRIASEMLRVLKPNGIILWYDYFVSKPTNPDTKGIGRKEIKSLFPNCKVDLCSVTLAPPLARVIAPYSWLTCYLLEKMKIFNTHYIGVIRKANIIY